MMFQVGWIVMCVLSRWRLWRRFQETGQELLFDDRNEYNIILRKRAHFYSRAVSLSTHSLTRIVIVNLFSGA